MGDVKVRFLGSGDAFGSGGRFQACISVRWPAGHLLLDCGASSLVAMKQLGMDPESIDAVVVSHLHGDHFGGIPFLVLDQQFARRHKPLLLAGPRGIRQRVSQAMEVLYPASSTVERRFEVQCIELEPGVETQVGVARVTGYTVEHPSGAPSLALRVACSGRLIAYTGDTSWTDSLVEVADGADLLVSEAYTFDKSVKYHMAYTTLRAHRPQLRCRRVVLTHLGPDALARRRELEDEVAEDGLLLEL